MNSRMTSCALFFNRGGMSPFTWEKTLKITWRRDKKMEGHATEQKHRLSLNYTEDEDKKKLQTPSPWLFAACNVLNGCRPSTSRRVWAGTLWVVGCTGAPGPSSTLHHVLDLSSPVPRTVPDWNTSGTVSDAMPHLQCLSLVRPTQDQSRLHVAHDVQWVWHFCLKVMLDAPSRSSYPVCILQLIEVFSRFFLSLPFHLPKVLGKIAKWDNMEC